jgi:hypothetical protein
MARRPICGRHLAIPRGFSVTASRNPRDGMRNARLRREDAFSKSDDHRQFRDGVVVVVSLQAPEQLVVDVTQR